MLMKAAWIGIFFAVALVFATCVAHGADDGAWVVSGVEKATPEFSTKREPAVDGTELGQAIAKYERNPDRAAMLFAIAVHESALMARIGRNECRYDAKHKECDPELHRDGSVTFRAWGLWQQWKNANNASEWGSTSLDVQAKSAVRLLRGAWKRCSGYPGVPEPLGAIRAYAGRGCDQEVRGEGSRLATYNKVRKFF